MRAAMIKRICLSLTIVCLGLMPAAASTAGISLSVLDAGQFHTSLNFAPGEFMSVGHSSITPGSAQTVVITGPNGYSVTIESTDTPDSYVLFCLPPYFNQNDGQFSGADMTVTLQGVGAVPFTISGLPEVSGASQDVLMGMLDAAIADIDEAIAGAQGMSGAADTTAIINSLNSRRVILAARVQELSETGTLTMGKYAMSQTALNYAASLIYADNLGLRKALGMDQSLAGAEYKAKETYEQWRDWFRQTSSQVKDVNDGMRALITKAESIKGTAELADKGLDFLSSNLGIDLRKDEDPLAQKVQQYLNFAQPLFDWITKQFTQSMINIVRIAIEDKDELAQMQQRLDGLNSVISSLQLGVLLMEDENAQQMIQDFGVNELLTNMSGLRQELQNWHDAASGGGGGNVDVTGSWAFAYSYKWHGVTGEKKYDYACGISLADGQATGTCLAGPYTLSGNQISIFMDLGNGYTRTFNGSASGNNMSGSWVKTPPCEKCSDFVWSASRN